MKHTTDEMTLAEIFRDPLIRAVMRADGVGLDDFEELMYSAATFLKTRDGTAFGGQFETAGPVASSKRTLVTTIQPLFAGFFKPCAAHM
ncbi:hypothetical protein [Rhizobium nepotum]|uniref:Uncharacterized protein n=1 Tax=Rhizobium nepotum 39/7 TaxID=1368418 RepID=A0ABR5CKP1_9HYPH|nr:hypothetical protein [Rhizobium nepotum]KJF65351.1 hypothetical protein RS75_23600 [Rhizobium nepotum 39/7]